MHIMQSIVSMDKLFYFHKARPLFFSRWVTNKKNRSPAIKYKGVARGYEIIKSTNK